MGVLTLVLLSSTLDGPRSAMQPLAPGGEGPSWPGARPVALLIIEASIPVEVGGPGSDFLTHDLSTPFPQPVLGLGPGSSAAPRNAPSGSLGFSIHPQEQSRDTVPLGTPQK